MKLYRPVGNKTFWPIGSVYLSVNSKSPATLFGGTWVQIEDGYFLEITTSTSKQTKQPGLPNITGSIRVNQWGGNNNYYSSGAFTGYLTPCVYSMAYYDDSTGRDRYAQIDFNAKNSSQVYGNSSTVQPKSFTIYAWYRTA
jgi:hypothetical protein